MLGFSPLASAPLADDGLAESGLAATSIFVGSPTVGSVDIDQVHNLSGTSVETGSPSVASADIDQVHTLAGSDISLGASTVASVDLDQDHIAAATLSTGAPSVGSVDLDQDHVLAATLSTGAPTIGSGALQANIVLSATSFAAGSPTIGGTPFLDYETASSNLFNTFVSDYYNSSATVTSGYISAGYKNVFDSTTKIEVNNISADSTKLTLYCWVERHRYYYNPGIVGYKRAKVELYYSGSDPFELTTESTTTTTSNPWGSTTVGSWTDSNVTSAIDTALSGKMTDLDWMDSESYVVELQGSSISDMYDFIVTKSSVTKDTVNVYVSSDYSNNTGVNGTVSGRGNTHRVIANRWLAVGSQAENGFSGSSTTKQAIHRFDPPAVQYAAGPINLTLGTASNMPLAPDNITVSPTVGSADLNQVHILAADDLTVGAPTIVGQISSAPFDVSLDPSNLTTGAPSVGSAALVEDIPISVSLSASATLSNNYTYLMGAVVQLSAESNLTNTFVGEVIRSHQSSESGLTAFTTLSSDQTSVMTWGSGAAGNTVTANFASLSANSSTSNLNADPILGNAGVAQLDATATSNVLGGIDLPGVASLSVTSDLFEASVRDRPGVSDQSAAASVSSTATVDAAGVSAMSSQSAGNNAFTAQMASASAISAAASVTIISTISFNSTSAMSASSDIVASGRLRFEPVELPTLNPWTAIPDSSSDDEATNPWTTVLAA